MQPPESEFERFADRVVDLLAETAPSNRTLWLDVTVFRLQMMIQDPMFYEDRIHAALAEIEEGCYCNEEVEISTIRINNAARRASCPAE